MPGPGTYDSTAAGSTKMTKGQKSFSMTRSDLSNQMMINQKQLEIVGNPTSSENKNLKISIIETNNSPVFKDKRNREKGHGHYIPSASNNTIVLENLGPGTYF